MIPLRSGELLKGNLVGQFLDDAGLKPLVDIVHVTHSVGPDGPAENAFVFVERVEPTSRARYVSWISYYDVDYVVAHQPNRWRVIEPPRSFEGHAVWQPFGWPGAIPAPTVGELS